MMEQIEYPISNRKKRLTYKATLLVLLAVLILVAFVQIGGSIILDEQVSGGWRLLWAISGTVLVLGIVILITWVYHPIRKIEQALLVFESYGEDFSVTIDRHSDIYPIAHSLNRIHSRIRESIDREYEAHMKQKDAEIHALQSQINPHFLYNTLDSIRGLALMNEDDEVADMTEALSVFFRYSIGQKGHTVTLQDELDNIKNYLVIQNNRFKNKLHIQVKVDEDKQDILRCKLPKLLLQPIIENAVFHGIEPKLGPGHISVRISATEKTLIINVQDDGIGMDEATLQFIKQKLRQGKYVDDAKEQPHKIGIALININQRIILNYGDRYGVTLASTQGVGSEVELTLPIIYDV